MGIINKSNFSWTRGLFLIVYQMLLLILLPLYLYFYTPSTGVIISAILLFFLSGFSITAGYHRLFSHRSYKVNPIIETILLFFSSMAIQGSALRWCHDHRLHHAYVDTEKDPYAITKGFWYAHFLWMLKKERPIQTKVVTDLIQNKRIMFQHKRDVLCMLSTNALAVLIVGLLFNDFLGAFFIAFGLRLFFLHHCTWFINSLAHTWGDKPFSEEHSAVNNYIISLLTFGEGYHNYHHTYANDYRNGVRWYQFDPTKWIIWSLSRLGLAKDLKSIDMYTIQKKLVQERKHILLERIKLLWYVKKEDLEVKIQELSDRLVAETTRIKELKDTYKTLRKNCNEKATLNQVRQEIALVKAKIRKDWRLWCKLTRNIMRLKPIQL